MVNWIDSIIERICFSGIGGFLRTKSNEEGQEGGGGGSGGGRNRRQ